jgi:hypothetical protein
MPQTGGFDPPASTARCPRLEGPGTPLVRGSHCLGHPGSVAEVVAIPVVGLERRMPARIRDRVDDPLDPCVHGESGGERDAAVDTGRSERVGRARRVRASQQPWTVQEPAASAGLAGLVSGNGSEGSESIPRAAPSGLSWVT